MSSKTANQRDQVVNRAVFLDRDGVINANIERDGRPVAPTTVQEFRLLPGVEEAIGRLKAAGFLVIVVTNQPDVGSGRTPIATVAAMHAEIRERLLVDDIMVCIHLDADNCTCRKPKPGLILAAAAERQIDLAGSYLVGDRWRDVEAGRRAGCLTILVDYGYEQGGLTPPDMVVRSLAEAVSRIIERETAIR